MRMNTMKQHVPITTWYRVFWSLFLLALPLSGGPVLAAAPSNRVDVTQIDTFVREQVQRHGIPGLALSLVEDDSIIYLGGYGKADQSGRAITAQTPFVLASASKPITALAIMQLVEAGKVELDAPVQRYLPTFRVADPVASQQITVRHLLQHTSGIPEQGCQNSRFGATTLEQFIDKLQTIALEAAPGTRHIYCSGNYNVLGRIVEVVSGESYAGYIEGHVFAPLQMRHSYTSERAAQLDGLAQGYHWLFGAAVPADYPYDPPQLPSGFLIASAEDMGHFLAAQLSGGRFGSATILSPEGIAAMQAPGVKVGDSGETYGLGWRTGSLGGVPAVAHAGDHPNAHTLIFIEPSTRRGAALLMNSQNMLAQFGAYKEIEAGVARLLAGQAPASAASLSLPRLYLVIDIVLGGSLALALWPLLRIRRWERHLRQRQAAGRPYGWWVGLRLSWDLGVALALLGGVRLLLHLLGAQSWAEGFSLFPDLGVWLWAFCGVMLLTGITRLVLLRQSNTRRDRDAASASMPHARG
jgi:CubicO group peptidase (beta-lactamase class C family)